MKCLYKKLAALTALAQLFACTNDRPAAELTFIDLAPANENFELTFQSNIQFFDLFSKNRHQRPVLSEIACSLDQNVNFDFEHRSKHFANGTIELAAVPSQGSTYRFRSTIQFWRAPSDEMGSIEMLTDAELTSVLQGKQTVPCVVRMTIYLSRPYYTKPMHIPVQSILAAVQGPFEKEAR